MPKSLNLIRGLFTIGKKTLFSNAVKNFGRHHFNKNLRFGKHLKSLTREPWLEFSNRQTQLSNLSKNKFARGFSFAFGFGLLYNERDDFGEEKLTDLVAKEFFLKETVDNFLNHSLEEKNEHIENSLNSSGCESITSFEAEDSEECCEEQETTFKDVYFPKETNLLTSNEESSENENDWSLLDEIVDNLEEETKMMLTNLSESFEVVSSVSSGRQQINDNDFEEISSSVISNFRRALSFDLHQEMLVESQCKQFTPINDEFWAYFHYFLENDPNFILKNEAFLEKLQSYFDI